MGFNKGAWDDGVIIYSCEMLLWWGIMLSFCGEVLQRAIFWALKFYFDDFKDRNKILVGNGRVYEGQFVLFVKRRFKNPFLQYLKM